jgi:hypothetical protein
MKKSPRVSAALFAAAAIATVGVGLAPAGRAIADTKPPHPHTISANETPGRNAATSSLQGLLPMKPPGGIFLTMSSTISIVRWTFV